MNVLLLSRYGNLGASSRYRSFQYLPFLHEKGFEITVSSFSSDLYLHRLYKGQHTLPSDVIRSYVKRIVRMLRARAFDLIWIEYEALPWLPYWLEVLFFSSRIPYVVDYDDAIFHRYNQHTSALVRMTLGKKIDRIMRNAAVVIAGNDYLASHARAAGAARVELLPTVVDLGKYPQAAPPNNAQFTIGWIGTPRTVHYLNTIAEALRVVCGDGNTKLVVIGAPQFRLEGVVVEAKTWNEETELSELLNFDVGIMPLVDSPWERGKCGHKLIKYMACSRPVIASPVGVNREIVDHGTTGFLAGDDPCEWIDTLRLLRNDKSLKEKLGEAGRRKIESAYCTAITAPRLARILESAVN